MKKGESSVSTTVVGVVLVLIIFAYVPFHVKWAMMRDYDTESEADPFAARAAEYQQLCDTGLRTAQGNGMFADHQPRPGAGLTSHNRRSWFGPVLLLGDTEGQPQIVYTYPRNGQADCVSSLHSELAQKDLLARMPHEIGSILAVYRWERKPMGKRSWRYVSSPISESTKQVETYHDSVLVLLVDYPSGRLIDAAKLDPSEPGNIVRVITSRRPPDTNYRSVSSDQVMFWLNEHEYRGSRAR